MLAFFAVFFSMPSSLKAYGLKQFSPELHRFFVDGIRLRNAVDLVREFPALLCQTFLFDYRLLMGESVSGSCEKIVAAGLSRHRGSDNAGDMAG